MTIDERLEFLMNSTESLHAACQELHASLTAETEARERTDGRLRQVHRATLKALEAYLKALDEDNNKDGGDQTNGQV